MWSEKAGSILKNSDYLGVSLLEWCVILTLTLLLWSSLRFLKRRFGRKIEQMALQSSAHWDDILGRMIHKTHGAVLFILSLFVSVTMLGAHPEALSLLYKFFVVSMFFQAALWGNEVLAYVLGRYLAKHYGHKDKTIDNLSTYSAVNITAKFVLWTLLFMLLLDNLGVDITALVTGLGIGGIAIALAVQNILGDIFASLTIVLDKPFEVGDYIVVDDKAGTVEAIGLKTSQIKALSGEQLIFPNKKLVEGYIQNFKRMEERRVQFRFLISYGTEIEKLEKIPGMLREIVAAQSHARFDRAHLAKLGDSAIEFEVIYYMLTPEYKLYMDVQEQINLQIYGRLGEIGARFSTPTPSFVVEARCETFRADSDEVKADIGLRCRALSLKNSSS